MKLRIKGNSLRLRITRSELARLLETGRVEETVHFATEPDAHLTYVLEHTPFDVPLAVRYTPGEIAVIVSSTAAQQWAGGNDVGLYGNVAAPGQPTLELAVEKDFACLDKSDAENADTFPNPHHGAVC